MGITFKENCPDIRNSRVIDIIRELETYEIHVSVYDPRANKAEVAHEYGITLLDEITDFNNYEGVILAVGHTDFEKITIKDSNEIGPVLYDVKGIYPKEKVDARL